LFFSFIQNFINRIFCGNFSQFFWQQKIMGVTIGNVLNHAFVCNTFDILEEYDFHK